MLLVLRLYLELLKTQSIPRTVIEQAFLSCNSFILLKIRLLVGDCLSEGYPDAVSHQPGLILFQLYDIWE